MIGITSTTRRWARRSQPRHDHVRFPKPVFQAIPARAQQSVSLRESIATQAASSSSPPAINQRGEVGRRMHAPGTDAQETEGLREPMRSFLFVPADSERKLAKGRLRPDGSSSTGRFGLPRASRSPATWRWPTCRAPARGPSSTPVNALDTGLTLGDLASSCGASRGIVFPKCVARPISTCWQLSRCFEVREGMRPERPHPDHRTESRRGARPHAHRQSMLD